MRLSVLVVRRLSVAARCLKAEQVQPAFVKAAVFSFLTGTIFDSSRHSMCDNLFCVEKNAHCRTYSIAYTKYDGFLFNGDLLVLFVL